jgi:transposase-like protein
MNLFSSIAKETGLSQGTLYPWRKRACSNGLAVPSGEIETERWSIRDKFNIVLETATLSKVELAEYCRSKGLFAEQVKAWQEACMQANGGIVQVARLQKELRQKDQELKKTEKELKRKEAALAETAALLVLRKKANPIWGDGGDA